MADFDPLRTSGQKFVEGQDRHVGCAGGEKSCLTSVNVAKFQMTFRLCFDLASPVEDCEHAKEGCSRGFRAERLQQFTVSIAHLTDPPRPPRPIVRA